MRAETADTVGFVHPKSVARIRSRRAMIVEVIATATLVVSLVIAATVVSIGMGRACAPPQAQSFVRTLA